MVCSIIASCVVHVHIYKHQYMEARDDKNINDSRQATSTEALATSDRENDEDILTCHNTDLLFFHILTVW